MQENNQADHQVTILRRDSTKENTRGVKSLVVNMVHQGITKRLASNLLVRINIVVLFSIIIVDVFFNSQNFLKLINAVLSNFGYS